MNKMRHSTFHSYCSLCFRYWQHLDYLPTYLIYSFEWRNDRSRNLHKNQLASIRQRTRFQLPRRKSPMRFWNTLKLTSRKSNCSTSHGNDHEVFLESEKTGDPERLSKAIDSPVTSLSKTSQQPCGMSDTLGLTRTLTESTITMEDDAGVESDKEDYDNCRLSARNLEGI